MLARLDLSLAGQDLTQALTPEIDAGNALQITVRPLTTDLAKIIPNSARYRIDDVRSGQNVTPWTALTPAQTMTVTLSGAQVGIINVATDFERKQFMVEATDSSGSIRRTLDYLVSNTLGSV